MPAHRPKKIFDRERVVRLYEQYHSVRRVAREMDLSIGIAGCLGLRISEISGLQWGDIDRERLVILVQRSFVNGRVYKTKREASQKPLPIDPQLNLAEALLRFKGQATYIAPMDFILAGNTGKPRWQGIMLTDHLKPAAKREAVHQVAKVLLNP